MKKHVWFTIGILACFAIAIGAYFWATTTIDSFFAYRSPLHADPPVPGQPVGQPVTRKVVAVLIDALRLDTSQNASVMPFLSELRRQGASAAMHSRPLSYSEPGYTTLFTGAWPDINDGPAANLEYPGIPTWTQDNLFSDAHRLGLKTAVSGYNWFEKLIPQEAVDASFYTPGEDGAADVEVVNAALPMLQGSYQLVLIHIDQVDYAGHYQGGPRDPRWDAAATRADDLLRQIAAQLDLGQDTLLVFSDHGQIDKGGHGGQEPVALLEPFVMAGAGVRPGDYGNINMVDVAPTMAALLGTNIPASNQGHVLTGMLTLTSEGEAAIQEALMAQQAQLFTAYTKAIDSTAIVAQNGEVVDATQLAMDQARSGRLDRERLWRGLAAFFVAAIPAIILILRRDKKVLWLLGGALVYALIFNLRYSVIDGNTYSLSSVTSQNEIILYMATTVTLALAVAWLAVMFPLRAFRNDPFRAAETALSLTLITVYLLSLPILFSTALNGILVGWTLPDFLTMYLGFISIIQCLMVAAIGLLLTGVSAVIAALTPRARRV